MNLLLGVSLSAISFLIAPLVADYFREPEATALLRVLGLTFTVEALGAVHLVRLQRELRFGRVFIPDVGRSTIKGAWLLRWNHNRNGSCAAGTAYSKS